jgi:hypothetical protein
MEILTTEAREETETIIVLRWLRSLRGEELCYRWNTPLPQFRQALFSSRFRIFPVAPIGNESLNSMMRGYL